MIDRRLVSTAAWVAIAALLGACSGAPSAGIVPTAGTAEGRIAPQRHSKTSAVFSLKIHRHGKRRHAHYLSGSTGSLTFAVYDSTHTHLYAHLTANTIPGFGGCTALAGGLFTCTFSVAAPAGIDAFDVTAFDNLGGTGNALSLVADRLVKIAGGKANAIPMVLDGIPKTVDIGLGATSPLAADPLNAENFIFAGVGPKAAQVLSVQTEDAEQNAIVGPGSPTYTMQSNDPADVSIVPVAGSPNAFKVTPLHVTSGTIQLTVQATPLDGAGPAVYGHFPLQITPLLYVANGATNTISEYASWSTSPILTIPSSAGIANPFTMKVDASGNLYEANLVGGTMGSLNVFAPGTTVASRTISGLSGPDVGLAIDQAGDIFVTEAVGGVDVKEFTPAGGNTPSRTLSSTTSPTGINTPAGLAIDAAGNLYVANNGGSIGVSVFAPGTSTTPSFAFNTGTNKPYYTVFDAAGNLYVSNYGGNDVTEYSPPFSSGTVVHHTFGSSMTTLKPLAIAVDSLSDVYIGLGSGTVVEYDSSGAIVRTLTSVGSSIPSLAVDPLDNADIPGDSANAAYIYAPGTSTMPASTFTTGVGDPVSVASWP
ncbi:MAG TPA: hypothetical protein VK760_08215 [Candidatus Acidoferrales bacterium]|jgi:hypothetical protein|nr:hypothetical protein [Candidatus Acidoferrales bacterium]